MKVLVSGSSGLVGSALVQRLRTRGDQVIALSYSASRNQPQVIAWNPLDPESLLASDLEGLDAVIHLAGKSIMGRWSETRKTEIRRSRVQGTRLLAERLAQCERRPQVLLSASAVGYYGDRDEDILTEASEAGHGFLADVCRQWEHATRTAADAGVRVACMRFGVVLAEEGGALARMLPAFRMGLGATLGNGSQYLSWITRDDLVTAMLHLLDRQDLKGPVNMVSPHPVRQEEFASILGSVLSRPVWLRAPSTLLQLTLGGMADEMLLASSRVKPEILEQSGCAFRDPQLEDALRRLVGTPGERRIDG